MSFVTPSVVQKTVVIGPTRNAAMNPYLKTLPTKDNSVKAELKAEKLSSSKMLADLPSYSCDTGLDKYRRTSGPLPRLIVYILVHILQEE